MITLTAIFLFAIFAFAWWNEAPRDAEESEARKDPKHPKFNVSLDHERGLIGRVAVCSLLFLSYGLAWHWLTMFTHPEKMWNFLWVIGAGWAVFTSSFRWRLNRLRGLDWRYVSPSNWYDWQFLALTGWKNRGYQAKDWDWYYANRLGWGRNEIHRSGTIAYTFEALVFTASILLAALA